jgi:hypothetical protein
MDMVTVVLRFNMLVRRGNKHVTARAERSALDLAACALAAVASFNAR